MQAHPLGQGEAVIIGEVTAQHPAWSWPRPGYRRLAWWTCRWASSCRIC
ncbi:MAG: hypothetical protein R2838_02510 [Caldilineaceae bacterium]